MTGLRTERARDLRREATLPERIIWSELRGRQLKGLKFRRQVPIDRYTVDFACFEARLVIEIDGSEHLDRVAQDEMRTRVLERCGFRVIRFRNWDVLRSKGAVIDEIRRALATTSSP